MIGNEHGSVVHVYHSMEIMQDKKSGKPEAIAPEGVGNPGVQVIVVGWRSVVCDHWRPFIVVVIVYRVGVGIILSTGRFTPVAFIACKGPDCDPELIGSVIKPLQSLVPAHR
jgi:hypothetical protein